MFCFSITQLWPSPGTRCQPGRATMTQPLPELHHQCQSEWHQVHLNQAEISGCLTVKGKANPAEEANKWGMSAYPWKHTTCSTLWETAYVLREATQGKLNSLRSMPVLKPPLAISHSPMAASWGRSFPWVLMDLPVQEQSFWGTDEAQTRWCSQLLLAREYLLFLTTWGCQINLILINTCREITQQVKEFTGDVQAGCNQSHLCSNTT